MADQGSGPAVFSARSIAAASSSAPGEWAAARAIEPAGGVADWAAARPPARPDGGAGWAGARPLTD